MQDGGSIPSFRSMNHINVQLIEEEKKEDREQLDQPQAESADSKPEGLKGGCYAAAENDYPTELMAGAA